jgi:hypothetical protein
MWWYNNIKVPLINIKIAIMWYGEHGTFKGRPRADKITPDVLEWADQRIRQITCNQRTTNEDVFNIHQ